MEGEVVIGNSIESETHHRLSLPEADGSLRPSTAACGSERLAVPGQKGDKRRMSQVIVVKAAFDPEAGVWYTQSSDVHGLRIEAATFDALVERVPGAVQDLLEDDGLDIPIEVIIAHASTHIRVPERA
ncbi:MAG TPA: DUF1902 domain-containing protein [Caulobacteraceae bacterium]|nr:DUF1902 domain-containing protein [Caulobacteraceae bacterium]